MLRRFHHPGFTLMELLLVLVILAVCAGIAAPTMRGFTRGRRLPNTAQEIVTMARWCRVQAISDSALYRLNLDPVSNRLWITKDDGTGHNFQPVVTDFIPEQYVLPDGISLLTDIPAVTDADGTNNGIYVTFDPGGRSDTGTITLQSDNAALDIVCPTPFAGFSVAKPEGGN